MHLSFLTSHNLLFLRFCKTSKKTTFSVFLSFFLIKSPKSQSLKLNISRTAWPILMILVSFWRILNGLSDEINLFWRCSSPLRQNGRSFQCKVYQNVKFLTGSRGPHRPDLPSPFRQKFQLSVSAIDIWNPRFSTKRPASKVFRKTEGKP